MPDYNKQLEEALIVGNFDQAKEAIRQGASLDHRFKTSPYSHPVGDVTYAIINTKNKSVLEKCAFIRFLMEQPGFNPNAIIVYSATSRYPEYKKSLFQEVRGEDNVLALLLLIAGAEQKKSFVNSSENDLLSLYQTFPQEAWQNAYHFYCQYENADDDMQVSEQDRAPIKLFCLFWISCFLGSVHPLKIFLNKEPLYSALEKEEVGTRKNNLDAIKVIAPLGYNDMFFWVYEVYQLPGTRCDVVSPKTIEVFAKKYVPQEAKIDHHYDDYITTSLKRQEFYYSHVDDFILFLFCYNNPEIHDALLAKMDANFTTIAEKYYWGFLHFFNVVAARKDTLLHQKCLPLIHKMMKHPQLRDVAFRDCDATFIQLLFEEIIDPTQLDADALIHLTTNVLRCELGYFCDYHNVRDQRGFGEKVFSTLVERGYLIDPSPRSSRQYFVGPEFPDEQLADAAMTCDVKRAKVLIKRCVHYRATVYRTLPHILGEGNTVVRIDTAAIACLSSCTIKQKIDFLEVILLLGSRYRSISADLKTKIGNKGDVLSLLATDDQSYPLILFNAICGRSLLLDKKDEQFEKLPAKIKSIFELSHSLNWRANSDVTVEAYFFIVESSEESDRVSMMPAQKWFKPLSDHPRSLFILCCLLNQWKVMDSFNQEVARTTGQSIFKKIEMQFQSFDALEMAVDLNNTEFFMMACLHCLTFDTPMLLSFIQKYPMQKTLNDSGEFKHEIEKKLQEAFDQENVNVMSFILFCYEDVALRNMIIMYMAEKLASEAPYDEAQILSFLTLAAARADTDLHAAMSPTILNALKIYPDLLKKACLEKEVNVVELLLSQGADPKKLTHEQLHAIFTNKDIPQEIPILLLQKGATPLWKGPDNKFALTCIEQSNRTNEEKAKIEEALIFKGANIVDPGYKDLLKDLNNRLCIAEILVRALREAVQRISDLETQVRDLSTANSQLSEQHQMLSTTLEAQDKTVVALSQESVSTSQAIELQKNVIGHWRDMLAHLESAVPAIKATVDELSEGNVLEQLEALQNGMEYVVPRLDAIGGAMHYLLSQGTMDAHTKPLVAGLEQLVLTGPQSTSGVLNEMPESAESNIPQEQPEALRQQVDTLTTKVALLEEKLIQTEERERRMQEEMDKKMEQMRREFSQAILSLQKESAADPAPTGRRSPSLTLFSGGC